MRQSKWIQRNEGMLETEATYLSFCSQSEPHTCPSPCLFPSSCHTSGSAQNTPVERTVCTWFLKYSFKQRQSEVTCLLVKCVSRLILRAPSQQRFGYQSCSIYHLHLPVMSLTPAAVSLCIWHQISLLAVIQPSHSLQSHVLDTWREFLSHELLQHKAESIEVYCQRPHRPLFRTRRFMAVT